MKIQSIAGQIEMIVNAAITAVYMNTLDRIVPPVRSGLRSGNSMQQHALSDYRRCLTVSRT
jgi:hypothetical protein